MPGSDQSHFCKPAGVAVSKQDGAVFVADGYCNNRVLEQWFNSRIVSYRLSNSLKMANSCPNLANPSSTTIGQHHWANFHSRMTLHWTRRVIACLWPTERMDEFKSFPCPLEIRFLKSENRNFFRPYILSTISQVTALKHLRSNSKFIKVWACSLYPAHPPTIARAKPKKLMFTCPRI